MAKLTQKTIENLKPRDRDYMIGDGHGLWLRVRTSGSKVFIVRKKTADKVQIITLGKFGTTKPGITLLEARRKALDPATTAPHDNTTVAEIADEYFDRVISSEYRRPHHVRGYLDKLIDALGKRKVRELKRIDLSTFIKDYSKRGKVAANRMLAVTRQCMSYAVEVGCIDDNPAQGLTRRIAGGTEKARERVMTDEEIRLLWALPAPHGPLLRFLLVTGQRIGETQGAQPDHVDGDLWHIPAENSKNARAHDVHLSPQALAIIEDLPKGREYIFNSTTNTAVQAYLHRWCDKHEIDPRFTPHDLRRTAATRMHGLGIAPHVVERVLNHTMQGVMAIYNQHEYLEERKDALLRWSVELERIVAG